MDFLLVPEVAARLRVSRSTVFRLLRAGHLTRVRVSSKSTRVSEQSVLDLIARGTQPPTTNLPQEP